MYDQALIWSQLFIPVVTATIAILYAYKLYKDVLAMDRGTQKMMDVQDAIMEGSKAFIKKQYSSIFKIGIVITILLYVSLDVLVADQWFPYAGIAFILGAVASLVAGAIAMIMAAETNGRTTQSATISRNKALQTAYKGGLVMGLLVVALSILGISLLFWLYSFGDAEPEPSSIIAFGFGASFAALFAQLGGGIFTKAADVGADLVGKLEAGIPEDDPRNPGVIADNVGDAVGDCAGRGADLFESISGETIGAMIIGLLFFRVFVDTHPQTAMAFIFFPLVARGISLLMTIVTERLVKLKSEDQENAMQPLTNAFNATSLLSFFVFAILIFVYFEGIWQLIAAAAIGIALAVLTLYATDYYTGDNKPVMDIVKSSETGPATNIITGLSVGMASTWMPVLGMVVAIISSYMLGTYYVNTSHLGGAGSELAQEMIAVYGSEKTILLWGVFSSTIATMAMLSLTPMILAMDGYGPIADQSGGIAEMGEAGEDVRTIIDSLDMVGNTTKALAKGYGMTSAGLAALLLFQAYLQDYEHVLGGMGIHDVDHNINLADPLVISALFIGALLPFIFTSMSMGAVGRAAGGMIDEIRRQFREDGPAIMAYEKKPDYASCVRVSTESALKEMIMPSILVVLTPVVVGFIFGALPLAAFLIGATFSGILLGLTLNNAGGAWDNAKKTIEAREENGKGSDAHAASVIGDTVGDPTKDTSGPSIHVLIKLINTIAITMIALFVQYSVF
ncbi:MAG: sodium-translocating pyrophosphatase [Candidatus Heimdallarchaeota archaeon]|nr:sodium-translocating pyrophosphatase [Candidatus Heimdallarchaeota archaeon]